MQYACRRCSNFIFILDLTPGFNGFSKDNCKTRREIFKFCDLVRLVQEVLRYHWRDPNIEMSVIYIHMHKFNRGLYWCSYDKVLCEVEIRDIDHYIYIFVKALPKILQISLPLNIEGANTHQKIVHIGLGVFRERWKRNTFNLNVHWLFLEPGLDMEALTTLLPTAISVLIASKQTTSYINRNPLCPKKQ